MNLVSNIYSLLEILKTWVLRSWNCRTYIRALCCFANLFHWTGTIYEHFRGVDLMDEEFLLRLLMVGTYTVFAAIRIRYRIPAVKRERDKYPPSKIALGVLSVSIIGYFLALILYSFYTPIILMFNLPLPSILRWLGVLLAITFIPILYWVHSTLDKQFSADLSIKKDHNLIEVGPYRKVRHPMYTVFIVFTISIAIISANLICIIFSILISISFPSIIKSEEMMLIDAFGDEYRSYMERTGRFFPPLRNKA